MGIAANKVEVIMRIEGTTFVVPVGGVGTKISKYEFQFTIKFRG